MCNSTVEDAVWTFDDLAGADLAGAVAWVTPSVRGAVRRALSLREVPPGQPLSPDANTLVVIGGGTLIDEAKVAAKEHPPGRRLIAVPSIWGSGAEASPIVVLNRPEGKIIRKDNRYLPDCRVYWPELAASIPPERVRHACGDCWTHALEAFLSPLGTDELRTELAGLIQRMLELPLGNDPRWFEVSAAACAASARSGVGLTHGIAHTLEPTLRSSSPGECWYHARLCCCFLWPVLQWSRQASGLWDGLVRRYQLDERRILDTVKLLHDPSDYAKLLPGLVAQWKAVLRDPCTRVHGVLVRANAIECFRR